MATKPVRAIGCSYAAGRPSKPQHDPQSRGTQNPMSVQNAELRPGLRVRLVNDPTRIGELLDAQPEIRRSRRLYKVRFPDIVDRIPEDQLEIVTEERMNPLDLLKEGKLGTPEDLRRALTHIRLTGDLADLVYSMEATNTDFYAHQFKPVLKLLQTPANGILIADEVGLGKTIEAGLIWTELHARFNFNRLVVLCPASLREKWKDELTTKIGVAAEICDLKEAHSIIRDRQSDKRGFAVIASMQGLRPPRGWTSGTTKSPSAEFARFIREMENEEKLIDLLVVDEAHHMRNAETATHRLGQLMRAVSDYVVLLSATPVHNHSTDLFSLLRLIDPEMFETQEYLSKILNANEPLIKARDQLLLNAPSSAEISDILRIARKNELLSDSKQLSTLMSQFESSDLTLTATRAELAYRLETINLLSHTITRTRKREVVEGRVVREPIAEFISMEPLEKEFYDLVTDIVAEYARRQDLSESFLQVTPQQQMASCMPAALRWWNEKRPLLQQEDDHWFDNPSQVESDLGPLLTELIVRSSELCEFEELGKFDSKYKCLQRILRNLFSDAADTKVIVFSSFRGTVAYLADRLNDDGISTVILQGGDKVNKHDIIKSFQSPTGPQVLLSTEVGGEGVDLQFCWAIINYDLPWNPMRLEQRIGRVDRLGQSAEKVHIWNLLYDDTIDARIYRRLYEKLDLCKKALGDFEPILGHKLGRLARELLIGRLTPQQQEDKIRQTALALESTRAEQERLESEAASLVKYGDYILKEVNAAHEMRRWITGADLQYYVTSCLNMYFPGSRIELSNASTNQFKLSLSHRAQHELSAFVKKRKLTGQTRLDHCATITCRFDSNALAHIALRDEVISQIHPLVRFACHKFSSDTLQLRPAVAIRISQKDLTPKLARMFPVGTYILAASLWSVRGIRNRERLAYEALNVEDTSHILGNDASEFLATVCITHGRYWSEVYSSCNICEFHRIANSQLFSTLEERYDKFVANEEALNWDRAEIQLRNLRRRFSHQQEVIERILDKHRRSGNTKLIPANEARLSNLRERYNLRVEQLESQREIEDNFREVGIAIVYVFNESRSPTPS